ncbi:hypothetical protein [Marixanthomonas spongiae]|uniref:Chain length determinant protein n=1 Tax=Marixanthomonas spongiae TaxID=2174845 RepID=A0A2U0I214_9FLAO|nr:hypothetical protein [Marixanthomonas spongiae]PVW15147.1 hypothetical protein DDV96_06985 [Marixanthomonas spongiae]
MSNQTTNSSEEIDLFYLFRLVGNFFKKCFIAAYRFILFLLKNWIILLALVIIGAVAGYFSQKNVKTPKEADVLTRINFNTVSYVYGTIDTYNDKVANQDTVFLKQAGLWDKNPLVTGVWIEPVVSFEEIATMYGRENRTLEVLFEDYEFEKDNTLNSTLKLDFKYHNMKLYLAHNATPKTIDRFMDYINTTPAMENLKKVGYANMQELITVNETTIEQIDKVLNSYNSTEATSSETAPITLDKDLTGLVRAKIQFKEDANQLKQDLLFSKDISVPVTKSVLVEDEPNILMNKIIVYPLILIFLFLVFAMLKRVFNYAGKLAKEEDENKRRA